MAYMTVCPNDLRFTQSSIKNTFRPPHDNLRLDQAVDRIRKKLLSSDDFPALKVVKHGGILWSLDNRRLWVFRKSGVTVVKVKLVSPNFSPRSVEFFKNLAPWLKRRYSSPAFYPRVRGHIESIPVESPVNARGEAPVPKLAQEDTRKFNEAERVGVSQSTIVLVANHPPPVAAAQYLGPDTKGSVGCEVCEMLLMGITIAGIGWGVLRFLHKFM